MGSYPGRRTAVKGPIPLWRRSAAARDRPRSVRVPDERAEAGGLILAVVVDDLEAELGGQWPGQGCH